jgi:hypothetical protein
LTDELVDVGLSVTEVTTLHIVLELACPPATSRVRELEGPEEVRSLYFHSVVARRNNGGDTRLLEVGASSDDLVDEVFNAENVVLAESLLDHGVIGKRDTLLVYLAVSSLVDEFADGLEVRLAILTLSTTERKDPKERTRR